MPAHQAGQRAAQARAASTCWTSRRPGCTCPTSATCSAIINRLVDAGNTVIVIEHNLDVIRNADWIIDLGPEGGSSGGELVFTGTPADLLAHEHSLTGQYLRRTTAVAA